MLRFVAVGALCLVAAWVVICLVQKHLGRLRRRRLVRRQCTQVQSTVLVLLHGGHRLRDAATAAAVDSAFATSFCPFRVFVAVLRDGTTAEEGAPLESRIEALQRQRGVDYSGQIRILYRVGTVPPRQAVRELLDAFPEKTVTVVADARSNFMEEWDRVTLEEVARVPGGVLSYVPAKPLPSQWGRTVRRARSSAFRRIMDALPSADASPAEQLLEASRRPLFPVYAPTRRGMRVQGRRLGRMIFRAPVEATALSLQFLAGSPRILRLGFTEEADPGADPADKSKAPRLPASYPVARSLHAAGVRIFVPSVAVSFAPEPQAHRCRTRFPVGDYDHFAGVDPERGLVSGRAQLGLRRDFDDHEILLKFGTRSNYDRARRLVSGQ